MAPKDILELIKHYYKVSIAVMVIVVTCAVLSRTVCPHWVNFIGLAVLAAWALWAGMFIHRINQECK